jgi:hypothetical protein
LPQLWPPRHTRMLERQRRELRQPSNVPFKHALRSVMARRAADARECR